MLLIIIPRIGIQNDEKACEMYYPHNENQASWQDLLSHPLHQSISLCWRVAWSLVCPVSKKLCRKLFFYKVFYVHRSLIKGFARLIQLTWKTHTKFDKLLSIKQKQLDAEKLLNKKHFVKSYKGKPTKRYIKCQAQIKKGEGISMEEVR